VRRLPPYNGSGGRTGPPPAPPRTLTVPEASPAGARASPEARKAPLRDRHRPNPPTSSLTDRPSQVTENWDWQLFAACRSRNVEAIYHPPPG
jgi:hypothetical protein